MELEFRQLNKYLNLNIVSLNQNEKTDFLAVDYKKTKFINGKRGSGS